MTVRQYEKVLDGKVIRFYEYRFFVDATLEYLSYFYVKFLKRKKKVVYERVPERVLVFSEVDLVAWFTVSKNIYTKYDLEFFGEFETREANEKILYGFSISNSSEISSLKQQGVEACLCIQNYSDIRFS
jgi:hypothetical protein